MNDHPSLPGVAGTVGLTNDPLRGFLLTIDGARAKRRKGAYQLPGADGSVVAARLKGRFLSEHPLLLIDGESYATGPGTSRFVLLISFLPVLFLMGGNLVAVLLAVLGIGFNLWVLRTPRTEAWKAAVILVGFMAAAVLVAIWAFASAWVTGLIRQ